MANAQSRKLSWLTKGISVTLGMVAVGVAAYGATNWVVGLTSNSSGAAQSATISKLTISAVSSPAPGDLLDPGDGGDVVVSIANANPFPVTITAVQLPTSTTYATGYTSSALTTTQSGCLATTPSDVIWNFSTATSGSSHTLTTPLTVAASGKANNPLLVTLGDDALMTASAPLACANTFFSMPALVGVTATGGTATATTSPATDGWTS
ncbi:MAG: hypothetical protein WAL61_01945 [Acidimicrobiales bacterium]